MTANFSRKVTDQGKVHLASLSGELDLDTARGLADWLIEISGSIVVVDLSDLTFMDSSGVTALLIAERHIAEAGGELILSRPPSNVMRTLEIVGLGDWVRDWQPEWDQPDSED